ncbi:MAG TPA: hypothetical protein VLE71_04180 [Actinomycetota bacterium]|nr:hypothetical protein [Actinomycetota bacterium]
MPDLESRMPELLRRAVGGPPRDPELERRVLRKARRRRMLNASVAGVAVVMLVAALGLGARELVRQDHPIPGDPSPSPSRGTVTLTMGLPNAVWPELTAEDLAVAQASAAGGHQPWRLDPAQTAAAFAVNVFDWDPADVRTNPSDAVTWLSTSQAVVGISNRGLASPLLEPPRPAPVTAVTLEQLGTRGEGGIWTVTRADSDLIELDPIGRRPAPPIFTGRLIDTIYEWSPAAWPMDATGIRPEGNRGFEAQPSGGVRPFRVWTEIPSDVLSRVGPSLVGVLVGIWDPEGTIVAGDAFQFTASADSGSVTGATGGTGATGVNGASGPTGVTGPAVEAPAAAIATRDAVLEAASKLDFDALEALIDPNHFSYNFDDGSNPVPIWRDDPSLLDPLVAILQMPFTTNREAYPEVDPSSPTVYIWASLVGSDLKDLTAEEQAMLDTLGITERGVRDMQDAFGGYDGPRAGIAEDGTWLWYVIGGD